MNEISFDAIKKNSSAESANQNQSTIFELRNITYEHELKKYLNRVNLKVEKGDIVTICSEDGYKTKHLFYSLLSSSPEL